MTLLWLCLVFSDVPGDLCAIGDTAARPELNAGSADGRLCLGEDLTAPPLCRGLVMFLLCSSIKRVEHTRNIHRSWPLRRPSIPASLETVTARPSWRNYAACCRGSRVYAQPFRSAWLPLIPTCRTAASPAAPCMKSCPKRKPACRRRSASSRRSLPAFPPLPGRDRGGRPRGPPAHHHLPSFPHQESACPERPRSSSSCPVMDFANMAGPMRTASTASVLIRAV